MITVSINGQTQQFEAPLNVIDLLRHLSLTGKRIAVEKNGEIVPKSQHLVTPLTHGDRLEIVVAVGGG